jgi:hypothetical protein
MIIPEDTNSALNMRLANFSSVELSLNPILTFESQEIPQIVIELRRHADLPYGFIFSTHQMKLVNELLLELKSIRSACFPYALFLLDGTDIHPAGLDLTEFDCDLIKIDRTDSDNFERTIVAYAQKRLVFDKRRLEVCSTKILPKTVDVVIVGGGVTGLYAANHLSKNNISFCLVEKRESVGGIWSQYANSTSQVNTSEAGYRMIEKESRSNRDHSTTREILEDIVLLARNVSDNIFLNTKVDWIQKTGNSYLLNLTGNQQELTLKSNGVILAINDRVGTPRKIDWENQPNYRGKIISGISEDIGDFPWKNKKVVIIGMGAFAVENARTALEAGAGHVTLVCRRHGTVCPKIIDYLNFTTAYDEFFKHDKKSNMRNMLLWKKLYDLSGATQPECWMGSIKHPGHTISVSDIWFIGHYLKKINTIVGNVTGMYEHGVIIDNKHQLDADIVLNCVGFNRNALNVKEICDYKEMYNTNYLDKDMVYLADAYIDDDAFNSFFGSSVLEMIKFYLDVYVYFFKNDDYETMIKSEGIETVSIEDRKWSHYIAGAAALMSHYPAIYETARKHVSQRTQNFMEAHDLETYIAANKREWIDTHSLLAGKPMKAEDCLPYVFQKLVDKKMQ